MSVEDSFLARLASGEAIDPAEYDQLSGDLPPELLASALARRFTAEGDLRALIEAARIYQAVGLVYEALEVCSRSPRTAELQRILQKMLPRVRKEYPDTRMVGKLLEEAFLVIDLESGKITRFPPVMPSSFTDSGEPQEEG